MRTNNAHAAGFAAVGVTQRAFGVGVHAGRRRPGCPAKLKRQSAREALHERIKKEARRGKDFENPAGRKSPGPAGGTDRSWDSHGEVSGQVNDQPQGVPGLVASQRDERGWVAALSRLSVHAESERKV